MTSRVARLYLALCLLLPTAVVAQREVGRDVPANGSLSGVVISPDGKVVAGAIVSLSGEGMAPGRGAVTRADGRFDILGLPAGRFSVFAEKPGFVASSFGAKRPGGLGTPLVVSAGQAHLDIVIRIWPGAVISGTLRDDVGRPVALATVRAVPLSESSDETSTLTLTNSGVLTDRHGAYRIFGLRPGKFLVMALPPLQRSTPVALRTVELNNAILLELERGLDASLPSRLQQLRLSGPNQRSVDLTPIFFPDSHSPDGAAIVELTSGREQVGVDVVLRPVEVAAIAGTLRHPTGMPAPGVTVQLTLRTERGHFGAEVRRRQSTSTDQHGRFLFTRLIPGTYEGTARLRVPAPTRLEGGDDVVQLTARTFWATFVVHASPGSRTDVSFALEPEVLIEGTVKTPNGEAIDPRTLGGMSVALLDVSSSSPSATEDLSLRPEGSKIRADGTFTLAGLRPGGRYRFFASGIGNASVQAALLAGHDFYDIPEVLPSASRLAGGQLAVTLSDKRTAIHGSLMSAEGVPHPDVFVVAFPSEPEYWGTGTRRSRAVRPDVNGGFVVEDLPPGEYFIGALTEVDASSLNDAHVLEELAKASLRVRLREGEQIHQDLRLKGG